MSRDIKLLVVELQPLALELISILKALNINATVISTLRTFEEQNALYAKGRTIAGRKVTNAKAGQSAHNHGAAFDIAIFEGGKYAKDNDPSWSIAGRIGESLGLVWLGRIGDLGHFEIKDWKIKYVSEK